MSSMQGAQKFQFKYENFLWLEIHDIRQAQKQGDCGEALHLLLTLFDYLPENIKNDFVNRRDRIQREIRKLANLQMSDFHSTHLWRSKKIEQYARLYFPLLMNEVSNALSRLGYMARVGAKPIRPSKKRMGLPE